MTGTVFMLLVCFSNNCVNHEKLTGYELTRSECLTKAFEYRLLSKPGTRTVCVSYGNGEIIDSGRRLKRGWQRGLAD